MKLFDDATINVPLSRNGATISFNTSNLTVIFAGACVGLDEIRKKRLGARVIGFNQAENTSDNIQTSYTKSDLKEYGFIPELLSRIDIIEEMRKLTTEDVINIIYHSDESCLRQYSKILESLNVDKLIIDSYLWECLAVELVNSEFGVRELNSKIGELFMPIIAEAFGHNSPGVCVIEADGSYVLSYEEESKEYRGRGLEVKDYFIE